MRPEATRFQISDFESAELASELHLQAFSTGYYGVWILYALAVLGLLSPILLYIGSRIKTKEEV